MDRATRNALLQQQGGLSGRTWLDAVVVERAMADALIVSRTFDAVPLLQQGQTNAAETAVLRMLYNDAGAAVLLDAATPLPKGQRNLIWAEAHRALCAAGCAADAPVCVEALWSMGGGQDAAVSLNTPLDLLMAEDAYQGSAWQQGEVLRLARSTAARSFDGLAGVEACAAGLISPP